MRTRLALLGCLSALALLGLAPATAPADGACPDDFQIQPVVDPEDSNSDHNNNGLICRKFVNGQWIGGPDDVRDDA